jgi:putative transcriptional regulator
MDVEGGMIGVDWGTTSLRAYRIGAGGAVLDRLDRPGGILTVPEGGFPGALADAIGVTRQTIIAIEQGRYSPSLESAFRISRVFGVDVEDVFGWGADPKGSRTV